MTAKSKPKKRKAAAPREMTPQQALFVAEFLKDLNATQAAIRAGYSAKTAQQQGSRLLLNVVVAAAIVEGNKQRLAAVKYDADTLLRELLDENRADIADLYFDDGNLRPISDWPLVWRTGLIQGIEIEDIYEGTGEDRVHVGQVKKLKISDRLKRKELLGKHVAVQAFKDKIVHDVSDPLTQLMQQISGNSIKPRV